MPSKEGFEDDRSGKWGLWAFFSRIHFHSFLTLLGAITSIAPMDRSLYGMSVLSGKAAKQIAVRQQGWGFSWEGQLVL